MSENTAAEREISVIRTPHTKDRPYFSMSRNTAQDAGLSWEARGVLAYLLSKPDDWKVQVKDLQQKCGRDKVRAILKELEAANYLTVERGQHNDATGKFAPNQYTVHETPFTEKPSTVSPSTANPPITYKRDNKVQKDSVRKQRARDPLFDLVALKSFAIAAGTESNGAAPRVARISNYLKGKAIKGAGQLVTPATFEEAQSFYSWYAKQFPQVDAPRDAGKFAEHFAAFRSQEAVAAAEPTYSSSVPEHLLDTLLDAQLSGELLTMRMQHPDGYDEIAWLTARWEAANGR